MWGRRQKSVPIYVGSYTAAVFVFEGCCFADGILFLLVREFRHQNLKIQKHLHCFFEHAERLIFSRDGRLSNVAFDLKT